MEKNNPSETMARIFKDLCSLSPEELEAFGEWVMRTPKLEVFSNSIGHYYR